MRARASELSYSRRAEDPVELTEYATFKEVHFLFGQRVRKCIAYSRREPPAQPAARVCAPRLFTAARYDHPFMPDPGM
jgi:hypothetical protein